jgi:hypothetical protein
VTFHKRRLQRNKGSTSQFAGQVSSHTVVSIPTAAGLLSGALDDDDGGLQIMAYEVPVPALRQFLGFELPWLLAAAAAGDLWAIQREVVLAERHLAVPV